MIQKKLNYHDFRKNKAVIKERKKKDRKIIIIFIFLSLLVPAFFYGQKKISKWWFDFNQPQEYKFVKPYFEDKPLSDFFAPEVKIQTLDELRGVFTKELNGLQGSYGLYFKSLDSGEEVKINSDEQLEAASVVKIIPMLLFYQLIAEGKYSMKDIYFLKEADKQNYGTGSMQNQSSGKKYTFAELLSLSGQQSDNTADYILRQILGKEKINSFLKQYKLDKTDLKNVLSSPEEIGKLFDLVYQNKILSQKYKNIFYDNLTDTLFEKRLSAGIPEKIRVVHKIGNGFNRSYNDCGIVFSPNPFILCLINKEANKDEAFKVIPKLARAAFEWSMANN